MSENNLVQEQTEFRKKPRKLKLLWLLLGIFILVQVVLFFVFDFSKLVGATDNQEAGDASEQQVAGESQGLQLDGNSLIGMLSSDAPKVKADGNYTGILIGGIDSREVEIINGEFINKKLPNKLGYRNIDSIMQLVLDHRTNQMLLISIPRDMGIDIRMDCFKFAGSFHWLYDKGMRTDCPEKGIGVVKQGIENITGFKTQYHVIVTLDSFQEIIRIVGEENEKGEPGLYIDNPRSFSELYPIDGKGRWQSVYFPEGRLFLTPYQSLQYARSRQYTGDWDRAARQQRIVKAVMERFVSMNVLANPSKIQSMLTLFQNKVLMSSPQSLSEIQGIISTAAGFKMENLHRVVLDTSFGGKEKEAYINKTPHGRPGGPYYMVPTHWNECPGNEFCKIQEMLKGYLDDPTTMP